MWDFVRRLRDQIPICLFSNTSELHETFIFDRYEEFHLFPQGIFSWRVGSMKPDLPIYEAAKELLGVEYDQILYIDDLPANIATGQQLGMKAIAYHPKRHAEFLRQVEPES
jgi:HAD superfamily hydrolase (TIGR01509 family)